MSQVAGSDSGGSSSELAVTCIVEWSGTGCAAAKYAVASEDSGGAISSCVDGWAWYAGMASDGEGVITHLTVPFNSARVRGEEGLRLMSPYATADARQAEDLIRTKWVSRKTKVPHLYSTGYLWLLERYQNRTGPPGVVEEGVMVDGAREDKSCWRARW